MSGQTGWIWAAISIALAATALGVLIAALFFDRARGRMRCPKCWYPMDGVPGAVCPECGKIGRSPRYFLRTRRRWGRVGIAVLLGLAAWQVQHTPRVLREGWIAAIPTTVLVLIAPAEPVTPPPPLGQVLPVRNRLTNETWTRAADGRTWEWHNRLFFARYFFGGDRGAGLLFPAPKRWVVGEPMPLINRPRYTNPPTMPVVRIPPPANVLPNYPPGVALFTTTPPSQSPPPQAPLSPFPTPAAAVPAPPPWPDDAFGLHDDSGERLPSLLQPRTPNKVGSFQVSAIFWLGGRIVYRRPVTLATQIMATADEVAAPVCGPDIDAAVLQAINPIIEREGDRWFLRVENRTWRPAWRPIDFILAYRITVTTPDGHFAPATFAAKWDACVWDLTERVPLQWRGPRPPSARNVTLLIESDAAAGLVPMRVWVLEHPPKAWVGTILADAVTMEVATTAAEAQ